MKENSVFYEKQRFRQWWLWLIIISVIAFTVYNFIENRQYFSIGFYMKKDIPDWKL